MMEASVLAPKRRIHPPSRSKPEDGHEINTVSSGGDSSQAFSRGHGPIPNISERMCVEVIRGLLHDPRTFDLQFYRKTFMGRSTYRIRP